MSNPNIWSPGAALNANSSIRNEAFTATAGQTVFTLSAFSYVTGTSSLYVFVSGLFQRPGVDFYETDSSTFTLASPVPAGTIVVAQAAVEVTGEVKDYVVLRSVVAAAEGDTTISFPNLTYSPGSNGLNVYVNGSKQVLGTNYTETNNSTIEFADGLNEGDVIEAVSIQSSDVIDVNAVIATSVGSYTATGGETTITSAVGQYLVGQNSLRVFRNGVYQTQNADYTESVNGLSITFLVALDEGDKVTFIKNDAAGTLDAPGAAVSYIPAGTGAVATNVQAKLRESVSVLDFGASTSANATTNTNAFIAALAHLASTGGTIYVPDGEYLCSPNLLVVNTPNITIEGVCKSQTYNNKTVNTSRLTFSSAGVGVEFTAAGECCALKNIDINGSAALEVGIKVQGTSEISGVNVKGCTVYGIWLYDYINQTKLVDVSSSFNSGAYGILVGRGDAGAVDGNNTIMSMDNIILRGNKYGMRIEQAQNVKIANSVIESNTDFGIQIIKTSATNVVGNIDFDTCWFENNNTTTGTYSVFVDSSSPSTYKPGYIRFDNCRITANVTGKDVSVVAGENITFNACSFGDGSWDIALSANSSGVVFIDRDGGELLDSGANNFEVTIRSSGICGIENSDYWIGKSPAIAYAWTNWNPSDVAGAFTNAPSGGTLTGTVGAGSPFTSAVNSSGTLTVTFAEAGRYKVTPWLVVGNDVAYTRSRILIDLSGGTCTLASNANVQNYTGNPTTTDDTTGGCGFLLTATAGQTLKILPKVSVISGGVVGNHTALVSVVVEFTGRA